MNIDAQRINDEIVQRLPAWALRLTLGMAYFMLSEVMLWDAPDSAGWMSRLMGCVLLAALVLDLIVRFHARDIPGVLLATGTFGIIYGVLVAPTGESDLLKVMILRPLGWFSLISGGVGLALMVVLWRGAEFSARRAAAAGGLGLLWGVWIHWFPAQLEGGEPTMLTTALMAGAVTLAIIGVATHATRRVTNHIYAEEYLRFVRWEWVVFGGGMAMLFGGNLADGAISALGLGSMVMLAGFTVGVLYFMRARHRRSMLRDILPPQSLNLQHYAALAGIFLLAAAIGHSIPAIGEQEEPAQATALITLLYLLGFLWVPATSIIMAVRAFIDLSRTGF